jgi:DNA topoisomerase I
VAYGQGFYFIGEDGRRIVDPEILARIRALAIPPAWEDVWIWLEARNLLSEG